MSAADPSSMGYTHFTPLGEESPESTLPSSSPMDFKAPHTLGLSPVPLSPTRSRHGSSFANGSGNLSANMASMTSVGDPSTPLTQTLQSQPMEPQVDYVTDTDAGPVRQQVLMPPSYNPEWATQHEDGYRRRVQRPQPARMNSIVKAAKGIR